MRVNTLCVKRSVLRIDLLFKFLWSFQNHAWQWNNARNDQDFYAVVDHPRWTFILLHGMFSSRLLLLFFIIHLLSGYYIMASVDHTVNDETKTNKPQVGEASRFQNTVLKQSYPHRSRSKAKVKIGRSCDDFLSRFCFAALCTTWNWQRRLT